MLIQDHKSSPMPAQEAESLALQSSAAPYFFSYPGPKTLAIKIHQAAIKEDTSRKHTSRDPSLERIIFNHLFVPRNQ